MTKNESRFYRSGGILIESDVPLDELAAAAPHGQPDLRIELAPADVIDGLLRTTSRVIAIGDPEAPWLTIERNAHGYVARWPNQMDVFLPDAGGRMLVHQRGEVKDSIPRLLLCQSLSFLLPAYGREGVHASAVEVGGRAVIIAGEPGRGKSTLASALCLAGGRLLADDLSIIRIEDGVPLVEPGSTKTWLLHGIAEHMFQRSENEPTPRVHKVAVGGDGIQPADTAYPLRAVYFLRFGDGAPHLSDPLQGSDAVVHFLAALFNMVVASPERLAVQFKASTEAAAHAVMRVVRWQPGPEAARLLAGRILRDVNAQTEPGTMDGGARRMDSVIPANGLGRPIAAPVRNDRAEQRREMLALLRDAGVGEFIEDGMDEPLLRTSQVAALLRSSDRTVRSWADAGKLKYVKTLGGRRLFPASAVMAAMRQMSGAGNHEEA